MTISEKLSQIRERAELVSSGDGLLFDHLLNSHADVLPLLEVVEAVMECIYEADVGEYDISPSELENHIAERLGGGDDER